MYKAAVWTDSFYLHKGLLFCTGDITLLSLQSLLNQKNCTRGEHLHNLLWSCVGLMNRQNQISLLGCMQR